jgi:putative flippase GtrA
VTEAVPVASAATVALIVAIPVSILAAFAWHRARTSKREPKEDA